MAITFTVMTVRFVTGGIEFTIGPLHWAIQPSAITDYGVAVAAILTVWVGREWINRGKAADGA